MPLEYTRKAECPRPATSNKYPFSTDGYGICLTDQHRMQPELKGEVPMRSSNLYGDPGCVQECYGYDAEKHADAEVAAWLNKGRPIEVMGRRVSSVSEVRSGPEGLRAPHATTSIGTVSENTVLSDTSYPVRDAATTIEQERADQIANWFLPEEHHFQISAKL
jgi:hypothetical protein